MPNIGHMAKLLDMHLCGKYANIYTTYEVNVINTVMCRKSHRQTDRQTQTDGLRLNKLTQQIS